MATENIELFCGPCSISRKKSKSTRWCLECEEGLCDDCVDHHKRMKMSRGHTTIDANQYEKLPSFIHTINPDCTEHKRKLELYCPSHKVSCCMQCILTDHHKCNDVTPLESMAASVKSSSAFQELDRDIECVVGDFDKLARSRSNNLNRITEEEARIKSEILTLRTHFNEHLDKLEEEISNELHGVKSREHSKIDTVLREVNERRDNLVSLQRDLKGIKLHATDIQAFNGIRHTESQLESSRSYMQYLQTSDTTIDVDISFETSPSVKLIMGKITSFGKINVVTANKSDLHPVVRSRSLTTPRSSREITLKSGKTSLTQIPEKNRHEIDVRKISLLFHRKISIPVGQLGIISSIIRLIDKKIIVAESSYKNGHLFLFNALGKYLKEIKITGDPWDVTQLDGTTIAVTYPDQNEVKLINCMSGDIIDTIPLQKSGWGLCSDDYAIFVGMKGNELLELDYFGNRIKSTTIKSRLENFHIGTDSIYYTDTKKHILFCVSLTGTLMWTYQNEYMRGPQSVTTDKYGNIFVACSDTHCIVVISPDRNKIRILLGKSVGLERPQTIYIDKENSVLLVSNRNGKFAAMYKIVYR